LVDHVRLFGDGRGVLGVGSETHAAQEEVVEAADEGVAMAECEGVAGHRPQNGDQSHHGEALHHGAENVLAADQSAVEKGQAGTGHQQDQGRGNKHPGIVAGGLSMLDRLLQGCDLSLSGWGVRCLWNGGRGQGECLGWKD
jgi:hypothetical protein